MRRRHTAKNAVLRLRRNMLFCGISRPSTRTRLTRRPIATSAIASSRQNGVGRHITVDTTEIDRKVADFYDMKNTVVMI